MARSLMSPGKDTKVFRSTADRVKTVNIKPIIMRGGIRF